LKLPRTAEASSRAGSLGQRDVLCTKSMWKRWPS
jgi:hypothetical protein